MRAVCRTRVAARCGPAVRQERGHLPVVAINHTGRPTVRLSSARKGGHSSIRRDPIGPPDRVPRGPLAGRSPSPPGADSPRGNGTPVRGQCDHVARRAVRASTAADDNG